MAPVDVYRKETLPEPVPPPPPELVYEAIDHDRSRGASVLWFRVLSAPAIVGMIASVFVPPWAAVLLMASASALVLAWERHGRHRQGAVLRVAEGELVVRSRNGRAELARLLLRDVTDVTLETKTIRRVLEGDSPIPAVRFTHTTVGPEVDVARIVVEAGRRNERVVLTDAYVAHMEATEWLGKIRVFLRKHGWLPEDERPR